MLVKAFSSILYYCMALYQAILKIGMKMVFFSLRNMQAWVGYQVPPSVEIGCFPFPRILTRPEMNLSATSMLLSWDIAYTRISLL